jgi:hypothetical protein
MSFFGPDRLRTRALFGQEDPIHKLIVNEFIRLDGVVQAPERRVRKTARTVLKGGWGNGSALRTPRPRTTNG